MSLVFSLSLCYSHVMLPFPQMDDSEFISWTYLGNGACPELREFKARRGTLVEDDLDMIIPHTKTIRKERTFILDGQEDGDLKGHYFVVQDGKRKRIDISRTRSHIRVHGKCMIFCISNPTIIKT